MSENESYAIHPDTSEKGNKSVTKNHPPKHPDHGKLMQVLCERTGKITDGAAQGKAANNLLAGIAENRWTFADIVTELDAQLRDSRTAGNWRQGQRVSYLSVVKTIGSKYDRRVMSVETKTEVETETLSVDEARALVRDLNETDACQYKQQIKIICAAYDLPVPMPVRHEKTLRVAGRKFTAAAVFEHTQDGWRIKETAPILKWLKSVPVVEIPTRLAGQGCSWTWV